MANEQLDAPGGARAVENGCTCPVLDNGHGKGYMGQGVFVVSVGCPLHHELTGLSPNPYVGGVPSVTHDA